MRVVCVPGDVWYACLMDNIDYAIELANALIDLHTAQAHKNWDYVEAARKRLQGVLDDIEDELAS